MPPISMKTLTPLWTGDIDRRCSKIKETSILGSLRWWYEALVRGLGGYACDPTSDERCPSKDKAGNEYRCDGCEMFGCAGWSRRFGLRIEKSPEIVEMRLLSRIEHEIFYFKMNNRKEPTYLSNWYKRIYESIPLQAFLGTIDVAIIPSSTANNQHMDNMVAFLLKLISVGGGLGAKSQIGFGLTSLENEKDFDLREGFEKIKLVKGSRDPFTIETLKPSLSDYFKLEVTFPAEFLNNKEAEWYRREPDNGQGYLQTGFALKFLIRNVFKKNENTVKHICTNYDEIGRKSEERRNKCTSKEDKRKYVPNKIITRSIFGSDLDEKWASLVHFSDAYKEDDSYKMRIWGFLPEYTKSDGIKCEIDKKSLIKETKEVLRGVFSNVDFSEPVFGTDILFEVVKNES